MPGEGLPPSGDLDRNAAGLFVAFATIAETPAYTTISTLPAETDNAA